MSKGELTTFITEQPNLINELTRNANNLITRIKQIEQHPPSHHGDDEDVDTDADGDARNRCRYNFNGRGMGGNNHSNNDDNFNRHGMGGNNHGNNDPFAKIKFSLPPFAGNIDPEAYLDWELAVQQNPYFNLAIPSDMCPLTFCRKEQP